MLLTCKSKKYSKRMELENQNPKTKQNKDPYKTLQTFSITWTRDLPIGQRWKQIWWHNCIYKRGRGKQSKYLKIKWNGTLHFCLVGRYLNIWIFLKKIFNNENKILLFYKSFSKIESSKHNFCLVLFFGKTHMVDKFLNSSFYHIIKIKIIYLNVD